MNRQLKWKVRLGYLLNVHLLILMTIVVGSGMLISRIVLPEFNREEIAWFRTAHLTLPFILLILVGMHIGLHWNWVVGMTKRLLKLPLWHVRSRGAAKLTVVLLLVYGSYAAYTYRFFDRIEASVAVVGIPYEGDLRGELMGKADDAGKEGYDASTYGHGGGGGHGNGPQGSKRMDEGKGPPVNGIGGEEGKDGLVNGIGSEEADQHENKGAPEDGLGGLLKAIDLFIGLLSVFVIRT